MAFIPSDNLVIPLPTIITHIRFSNDTVWCVICKPNASDIATVAAFIATHT